MSLRKLAAAVAAALVVAAVALFVGGLGISPVSAETATITLTATADTYISKSAANTNFGSATTLAASANTYRSFFRFDTSALPSGVSVTGATLRLYSTTAASGGFEVHPLSDVWTESTVTYNNAPAWNRTVLALSSSPARNAWLAISLPTSSVAVGGNVSLGLSGYGGILGYVSSRETANKPQLVLSLSAPLQ